jgi:hypothetical protein
MNSFPPEIIEYIGNFVIDIEHFKTINKEFYLILKKEDLQRRCQKLISKIFINKKQLMMNNDIYYNNYLLLSPGMYKIYSTNSHHHLFIRLDTYMKYMSEDDWFIYEPAILSIDGVLTPGKISFERFIY